MNPNGKAETVLLGPMTFTAEALDTCAAAVTAGRVLLYPTDTIYGLGCDALNADAVRRVYEIKRRPETMPMIVLVGSVEEARGLASGISPKVSELLGAVWPGPLTILLRANARLYPWLSAGSGKIGVRLPKHAFCRQLMEASRRPLLSTSANHSGESYVGDMDILRGIFEKEVDLIVESGRLPDSLPSTIVDGTGDVPRLVRQGAVPEASLQRFFA